MQEMDPRVFLAVFHEWLGPWLWVLLIAAGVLVLAFLAVLLRERGRACRRLCRAQWFAIPGGVLAVVALLWLSSARLSDLAAPIDWLLLEATFLGGLVASSMVVVVVTAVVDIFRLR